MRQVTDLRELAQIRFGFALDETFANVSEAYRPLVKQLALAHHMPDPIAPVLDACAPYWMPLEVREQFVLETLDILAANYPLLAASTLELMQAYGAGRRFVRFADGSIRLPYEDLPAACATYAERYQVPLLSSAWYALAYVNDTYFSDEYGCDYETIGEHVAQANDPDKPDSLMTRTYQALRKHKKPQGWRNND